MHDNFHAGVIIPTPQNEVKCFLADIVMPFQRLISTAPMLDYSDTHCRYFWRLFSKHAWLYTEMIHANAILQGNRKRALDYHHSEHPVALQLGGHDPRALAECSVIAQEWGYDEVNLNIGCPSDRVQSGQFGACLMREPAVVAACVAAMCEKVTIPITVKTRIGVDHDDSYAFLCDFIGQVAQAGCSVFIVHARKAWLKGLSPKQNRTVPPINYDRVFQLKKDFPHLTFILNGAIKNTAEAMQHLDKVDGIMVGREAYTNPYLLSELEQALYAGSTMPTSASVLEKYVAYIKEKLAEGVHYKRLVRPLTGLYYGQPYARQWRIKLSTFDENFTPDLLSL